MMRPDWSPAEIRAWTAANQRAREEFRLNPHTHESTSGPCLRECGRTTTYLSGVCRVCAKEER